METTLSGIGPLRLMATARTAGYRIELHYVFVNAPELAIDRIRNRVALGGHDVPERDVKRRYARSLARLPAAIARGGLRHVDIMRPESGGPGRAITVGSG